MTDLPVLYSFRRCPYAMRARMALAISGTRCRLREVELKSKPAEMLELSPKATVPVLVTGEGQVIDQSLDIMLWALGRNDPEHWLGGDCDALIAENDGSFKAALDRYKYPTRHGLDDPLPHRAAGLRFLEQLNDRLEACAFLAGDSRTLPDITIFPFVRQFAEVDRGWFDALPLPRLQSWLGDLTTSFLFKTIMHKYAVWHLGQVEPVFPAESVV